MSSDYADTAGVHSGCPSEKAEQPQRRVFQWRAWIEASRPRMLPLALASGIVPGAVAARHGVFSWPTLVLELLLCTVLLIVSIWADDYGDITKGVDNERRLGPIRPVQRGVISAPGILRGAALGAFTAFLLGVLLVFSSFGFSPAFWRQELAFLGAGLVGIWAAFAYTMGKRAYGYRGWGDASSFVFFGLLAGAGGFYLYGHFFDWRVLLPMAGVGALFVSTVNLQNIRDFENDARCGKRTTAVVLGQRGAVIYQFLLVAAAIAGYLAFLPVCGLFQPWRYVFVVAFAPLLEHLVRFRRIIRSQASPRTLDTLMWPLSRGIGILAVLFSLCVAI